MDAVTGGLPLQHGLSVSSTVGGKDIWQGAGAPPPPGASTTVQHQRDMYCSVPHMEAQVLVQECCKDWVELDQAIPTRVYASAAYLHLP